jgi:hypothetical protein
MTKMRKGESLQELFGGGQGACDWMVMDGRNGRAKDGQGWAGPHLHHPS